MEGYLKEDKIYIQKIKNTWQLLLRSNRQTDTLKPQTSLKINLKIL